MRYRYYLTGGHFGESKFPLGLICYTPEACEQIAPDDIATAMARHSHCDWGDMPEQGRCQNDAALRSGLRLLSVYHAKNAVEFWIITEADRSSTTVLLPYDR